MSFHNREITHSHDNVYKLVSTMRDAAGHEESRFNGEEFVREEDTFFANSLRNIHITQTKAHDNFLSKYLDDGK